MCIEIISNMTEVRISVPEVKASVAIVQAGISQVCSSLVHREEFDTFKSDVDSRFVAMSEISSNSVETQDLKIAIQRQARVCLIALMLDTYRLLQHFFFGHVRRSTHDRDRAIHVA